MSMDAAGNADLARVVAQDESLDHFPFPALHLRPDGHIAGANRAARDLADRIDCGLAELLPLYHATYAAEARKRPGQPIAACTRAYDPETVLQWSYQQGEDDVITMFAADISGLSRLAEHLAESQDRLLQSECLLRRFIDHVPIAVAMFDRDMRYLLASRKWLEDFNFISKDFIGKSHYSLIAIPEAIRARHRRALQGETPPTAEMVFTRPDSGAQEWVHSQVLPWRREDGEIGGVLVFAEVITARKLAEEARERRQATARQQQKMESLGTLAAGIAHEIGSPIQYINDNLGFLEGATADLVALIGTYRAALESATLPETVRRRVAKAEAAADLAFLRTECAAAASQARAGVETIGRIIGAVKTFVNPAEDGAAPADLNAVIRDALLLSRNRWQPVAETRVDLDDTVPLILAHTDQLGQAILNIVVNAAQAISDANRPERGTISVRSRDCGSHVEVEIADNGVGIAPQHLARVFEPFFTTRAPGQGSGQGLSIAHAIVTRAHGGELRVESQPGQSTRFTIVLPYENSAEGKACDR
jgi:PAS domain S-box-containing protein